MSAPVVTQTVGDATSPPPQGETAAPQKNRWYALGVLVAIYATMHMDRQIVTLLLEPIKLEFGLSDSQLGFLAGTSFAVAFAITGIPLGMLVDRLSRVRLLSGLIAIWSGLTVLCAFAGSYAALVLARIGIGGAESGGSPSSSSLIGDLFGRKERPLAFGIYHTGTQIGSIVGFAAAAIVAQAYGWRAAFLMAGLPGLVLVFVLLFTVREPRRGAMEPGAHNGPAAAPVTFRKTFSFILSQRAQVHTFIGIIIAMMVTAGLSAWLAPLMMRGYGVSLKTAGLSMAFGISSAGVLGALTGGWLASRFGARNAANLPRLIAFAMLLCLPSSIIGILSNNFAVTVGGFAIQHFANAMIVAIGFGLVLELTQVNMRGTTMALLLVMTNMIGYGFGPQFIGWLSDGMNPLFGPKALPYAMTLLASTYLWAAVHMLLAVRSTVPDIARASALNQR